ncbi:MAG: porin [Planctomycetaceae bacterium]
MRLAICVLTAAAVMCTVCPSGLCDENVTDEDVLKKLVQRLDSLEKENQQLHERLDALEQPEPDDSAEFPSANEAASGTANPVSRTIRNADRSAEPPSGWMYSGTTPASVFSGIEGSPLLTEGDVRNIVAEEVENRQHTAAHASPASWSSEDPALDAAQSQKISELDAAFKSLQEKMNKKTYPNVTVNGVFQADSGWIHQDSNSEKQYGQIQDGSDFRRARLSAKGSVTELTNYFFQMDFGFIGRPTVTDVWVEQTKVPFFGNVRIGQWKQPFSLEVVSSFRYTTFMERSVLFQPFTPFRHIAIGFYDYSEDLTNTWAASVFRTGQDQFGGTLSSDGGYGTAERLTWLPSWEDEGKEYLHLGIGHFFNAPPADTVNFRTIPEFFVGANGPGAVGTSGQAVPGGQNGTPFFVATGNIHVPYYNVLGSELLWVNGPLSVQSEAMVNFVSNNNTTAVLPGAYAQVGYFLTGEHRPYDRKAGAIDRVIPKSNLTFAGNCCNPGLGAWEVAGRWSYLDLNDQAIRGGTIMDYTAGVNWYWNPYTKMVFNYVHSISDSPTFPESQTDLFGVRAQVDF